jgi:hypothetical protein
MILVLQVCHLCQPYHYGKKILQMRNQKLKVTILSHKRWNSPQTWMHLLNERLLILDREENGVKHDWINSELLLRDGMIKIVLWLMHGAF